MYSTYLREIKDNLGYFATWLPGEHMSVGSVGVIDKGGRFHAETTLQDLGVKANTARGVSRSHLKHRSAGGVTIEFKTAGAPPPNSSILAVEDAGFTVSFKRDNAIVFEAIDCTHETLVDIQGVGEQLLERVEASRWRDRFLIVTGTVRAASATILVSNSSIGKFEATISGSGTNKNMSIGDATLGLLVKRSISLGIEITAEKNLTPLFSAYRIRRGWWRDSMWMPAKGIFEGVLEEANTDDLLAGVVLEGESSPSRQP